MELYKDADFMPEPRPKDTDNSLRNQIVAMSKSIAKAQISWSLEERKIFIMCLTRIAWKSKDNSNEITLNNDEVIRTLQLQIDDKHQSEYLRKMFNKLRKNSDITWTDPQDKENYIDGAMITHTIGKRGTKTVVFNPIYMPHLENLANDYITYLSDDIYDLKSKFAYILFTELRLYCDTRKTNWREYTTEQLKQLFGLKKDDYTRKKDGQFNRSDFEKYVLDRAIDEINQTQMMRILPIVGHSPKNTNGTWKCYEKIKQHGYIKKYRFKYIIFPNQIKGQAYIHDYGI